METKKIELTCIGCPMGCPLTVTMENGAVASVTGNTCPRGDAYARKEVTAPTRIVTSTVRVIGVVKVEKMKVMSGRKVYCGEGVWMGCADDALLQGMDYEMILNGAIRFG